MSHIVLSNYIKRNSDQLRLEVGPRNLFLPTALGGLGLEYPVGFKFEVTSYQGALGFARKAFFLERELGLSVRPTRGLRLKEIDNFIAPSWYKKELEDSTRTPSFMPNANKLCRSELVQAPLVPFCPAGNWPLVDEVDWSRVFSDHEKELMRLSLLRKQLAIEALRGL